MARSTRPLSFASSKPFHHVASAVASAVTTLAGLFAKETATEVGGAGNCPGDFSGPRNNFLCAFKTCAFGQLRKHDQIALVLCRDETGRHDFEAAPRQQEKPGIYGQRDAGTPKCPTHRASIAVGRMLKRFVEQIEEPSEPTIHAGSEPIFFCVVRLQQNRTECRRK